MAKYTSEYGDQKQEILNAITCHTIMYSQGYKTELKDFVIDWHRQLPKENELNDKIKMFFGVA